MCILDSYPMLMHDHTNYQALKQVKLQVTIDLVLRDSVTRAINIEHLLDSFIRLASWIPFAPAVSPQIAKRGMDHSFCTKPQRICRPARGRIQDPIHQPQQKVAPDIWMVNYRENRTVPYESPSQACAHDCELNFKSRP